MTKVHESFSAFLDGEASELDVQRMLNAMEEDPSVIEKWHQVSCAQAVLHGDEISQAGLNSEASAVEPKPEVQQISWMPKISVAALFAVAISSGYWVMQTPSLNEDIPRISVNSAEPTDAAISASQFQAQQRLEYFLKQHIEQASFSTGHGVIPSELIWTEVKTADE